MTYLLFNQVAQMIGDPPQPCDDPDFTSVSMPVNKDHDSKFSIPTLDQLGEFYPSFSTIDQFN